MSIPNCVRSAFARSAIHRVVCALLAVAFGLSALPLWSVSAVMQMGADCCQGKAAGHCESTILKKARQRKPEPMCGLKPASVDDGITIVAETVSSPDSNSSSLTRSIGRPCPTECCAIAASVAQKKKEQGTPRTKFRLQAVCSLDSKVDFETPLNFSVYSGSHIVPRGPPAA
ncbi:MAG TPA: hypothetical protein VFD63_04265 [Pyrinomonadaceae bacterium]|nr:hypothetical protein [Pyrinomonadaceae bacterium]